MGQDAIKVIGDFNSNTSEYFQIIKKILYYSTHPVDFLKWFWFLSVEYSFYVSLAIFMLCLLGYMIGIRRCGKYAQLSFFIYLTIQVFNAVML